MNVEIAYNIWDSYAYLTGDPKSLDLIHGSLRAGLEQIGPPTKAPAFVSDRQSWDRLAVMPGALSWLVHENVLAVPHGSLNQIRGLGLAFELRRRTHMLEDAGILRDYQAAAISAAVGAPWGRGIIHAPTGAGKTYIAAGLMTAVGGRWAYVVPNRALAEQSEATFLKAIPAMCAHVYDIDEVSLNLPSVKCLTYSQLEKDKSTYHGHIVDECHGAAASNRSKVLLCAKATWHIGMSATPLDRQDQKNGLVIGLLGPIIYTIGADLLEKEGRLAKGRVIHLVHRHTR